MHTAHHGSLGGFHGEPFRGALYNHGIALVALLTTGAELPLLHTVDAGRALVYLLDRQRPEGAWGYVDGDAASGPVDVANESLTYWALRALLER